jgi:hypothetical protein
VIATIRDLPATVIHVTHRAEETADADLVVEIAHGRVNSVRTAHSHGPQGSPGFDVTGGDRQFRGRAVPMPAAEPAASG